MCNILNDKVIYILCGFFYFNYIVFSEKKIWKINRCCFINIIKIVVIILDNNFLICFIL